MAQRTGEVSVSRRDALTIGLAVAVGATGLMGSRQSRGADPVLMKLGSDSPAGHPYNIGLEAAKKEIEAKTSGRVKVTIYPDAQLGGEESMTNGLKIGSVDGLITSVGVMVPAVSHLAIFDLPFLFRDLDHMLRVANGLSAELNPRIESSYGAEVLGWGTMGSRNMFNSRRAIKSPQDLKGLKMRVSPSSIHHDTYTALGALPVSIPFVESYTALQTKVADGADFPIADVVTQKMYQVMKYLTRTQHAYIGTPFLVSKRFLAKLTPDDQGVVRDACKKATLIYLDASRQQEAAGFATLAAKGVQITTLEDRGSFVKLTEAVYAKNADSVGGAAFVAKARQIQ